MICLPKYQWTWKTPKPSHLALANIRRCSNPLAGTPASAAPGGWLAQRSYPDNTVLLQWWRRDFPATLHLSACQSQNSADTCTYHDSVGRALKIWSAFCILWRPSSQSRKWTMASKGNRKFWSLKCETNSPPLLSPKDLQEVNFPI